MWKVWVLVALSAPSGIVAQTFSGTATYYDPGGTGACGLPVTGGATVALNEAQFAGYMTTGNPNENPVCGKSITITSGGNSVSATITDRCPGCAQGGLDLTPSLFEQFAPLGDGHFPIEWSFDDGEPAGGSGSGASTGADSGAESSGTGAGGGTGSGAGAGTAASTQATQQTDQQGDAGGSTAGAGASTSQQGDAGASTAQPAASSQGQQQQQQATSQATAAVSQQTASREGGYRGGGGRYGGGGGRGGRRRRGIRS